ncbi:TetR/AcrR family transcriptional regulator [Streptomyces ipomoeae]|uniref:TetR/AcrR family transcriptional regulator n=1 Tax=Streptomyces ipomoeae TaxID=103232 RepID=UPI00114772AE|nr:TetR/AcrR family transcriptional regulator [Streptomyces ipomoeae]MDX2937746.1 TetR/AcrR family transcriptional regulator [Streptomyces ipomoeae]TQE17247.1 TetR/AcrR family transcriptional regulator [Streptomyces ipomoeae]
MARTLTRREFFGAASSILADEGVEGLNIVALCARLGVTRGSFYHHFDSLADFNDAYLGHWENVVSQERLERVDREVGFDERSEVSVRIAESAEFRTETALRAWAVSDDAVRDMLRRVDRRMVAVVRTSLLKAGATERQATVYANMAVSMYTGLGGREQAADPQLIREMYSELKWAVLQRVAAN